MAGCADRARLEHQGRAWLAWHAAALPRLAKLPDFAKFTGAGISRSGGKLSGRRQSVPEMIAALKAHTSLMEGNRNNVSGHRKPSRHAGS
jgi:hypothetical protein